MGVKMSGYGRNVDAEEFSVLKAIKSFQKAEKEGYQVSAYFEREIMHTNR